MRWLSLALGILLLLSAVGGRAWGVSRSVYYTVTDLGSLGGSSAGLGINNSGQVVGAAYDANNVRRAFLYSSGTMTDLGTLGGTTAIARDINDSGQIVGSSYTSTGYRAFIDNNGTMTSLGTLPGDYDSYGRAINSSGEVAGISRDYSYNAHAFLYKDNTMYNLGTLPGYAQSKAYDINDSGSVVGVSYNFLDSGHAFVFNNGTMTDLGTLGGLGSYARAINDSGQVVGASYNASNISRAFLYDNGSMKDLGALGGWGSYARDINSSGQIVGSAETAVPGVYHGFLYSNGVMTDLKSRVDPASRWVLQKAISINDSGSIVGQGLNATGDWDAFLMTPITRDYASLSLPTSYSDLRTMQGSSTVSGSPSIGIDAAANNPTGLTLASATLTMVPASTTVAPAAVTPVPVSLRWTDTTHTGSQTGSIALANTSDPADPGNHTMGVTGAVLANRVLNIPTLGTSLAPVRTMAQTIIATTISSGSGAANDDDHATRVNTVNGSSTDGKARVTFSASQPGGKLLTTFDGPDESANLAVTFAKTGHYTGSLNLAAPIPGLSLTGNKQLLSDGEATSVGAAVQPATLTYDVEVLEARRLKASVGKLDLGDVLCGAPISADFAVISKNQSPGFQYTTMVNVAPGGTHLGALTASQTLVSGAGAYIPLTGTLNTYGTVNVKGVLPVATAEAPSVHDITSYNSLAVQYKANVGIAKLGHTPTSFDTGGTVLSASVGAHSTLTNLSSKVNPKKTLAANSTLASSVAGPSSIKGLYGAVGSEATILDSTAVTANTTVTMQWRQRLLGEAHDPSMPLTSTLPADAWLTSDVVRIGGVGGDVTYALQMSFDNRINLALDGQGNGAVDQEFANGRLFLAEFDTSASKWVNAGTGTGTLDSFADFMTAHPGTPLSDLTGSWGVDPSTSATGIGHCWAIVTGSPNSIFAVDPGYQTSLTGGSIGASATVPEPSALALLVAAAAAFIACGLRRWVRRSGVVGR